VPSMERLERIPCERRFAPHGRGNKQKVRCRDLELTESECSAPVCFALDERQLFNQWLDRCFLAFQELHVDSIRLEIGAHLDLIDVAPVETTPIAVKLCSGSPSGYLVRGEYIANASPARRR